MEIDQENLVDTSKETNLDVFKSNYEGQTLTNNPEFDKFTKKMKDKIGNNARLFKCKKDNVYFYHDYSIFPYYEARCPIYTKSICYFCFNTNEFYFDQCCLIKKVYYMFTVDGYIFFDSSPIKYDYKHKFKENLIFALIPFINMVYFIGGIKLGIFYNLQTIRKYPNHEFLTYEQLIGERHHNLLGIVMISDIIASVILSLCFIFINAYFIIFMLIISLPFKLYPYKFLFGIPYSRWCFV